MAAATRILVCIVTYERNRGGLCPCSSSVDVGGVSATFERSVFSGEWYTYNRCSGRVVVLRAAAVVEVVVVEVVAVVAVVWESRPARYPSPGLLYRPCGDVFNFAG